jgi:hypothetical protein
MYKKRGDVILERNDEMRQITQEDKEQREVIKAKRKREKESEKIIK